MLGSALFGAPAYSAEITEIRGIIRIDHGRGFQALQGHTTVASGARIIADPKSSATIAYSNGCREKVTPGVISIVKTDVVCTAVKAENFMIGAAAAISGMGLTMGLTRENKKPASP